MQSTLHRVEHAKAVLVLLCATTMLVGLLVSFVYLIHDNYYS